MLLTNLPKIRPSLPFIGSILGLIYIGVNVWIYFYGPSIFDFSAFLKKAVTSVSVIKTQRPGFATITPQPVPVRPTVYPLASGRQEYTVQYGDAAKGPKIQRIIVDPIDVKQGEKQTVTLEVKNGSPVISATGVLITDNQHQPARFTLVSGSPTDGTWRLIQTMNDSYTYTYQIYLTLKSSTGNWEGAVTLR